MSKIALLQFDPTVGDLEQNCRRLSDLAQLAESHGAAVGVSTELAVCGYPPRDLLMERDFVEHSMEAALQVSTTLPVLIGARSRLLCSKNFSIFNSIALSFLLICCICAW